MMKSRARNVIETCPFGVFKCQLDNSSRKSPMANKQSFNHDDSIKALGRM
jgi:hypothetical protein